MTVPQGVGNRSLTRAGVAASLLLGAPLTGAIMSQASMSPDESAPAVLNGLGGDLQLKLSSGSADPNGNLVFSPFSVGVALTMAAAGAAGDTAAQMSEVLGLTTESSIALATLVGGIEARSAGSFAVANSLWTQDGLTIEPGFSDLLAGSYGAELQVADFGSDPGSAVRDVNGWVADATNDRIPDLLSPDQVTDLTRFILVNAVHLDADWRSPFDPALTNPGSFTRGDGTTVETDFMGQTLSADYGEAAGVRAIVLPYTAGSEMVVVLPAADGLGGFEQALAAAGGDLDVLLGQLTSTEVRLRLPTWDMETSADLVSPLEQLGMTLPFSDAADFSNITTDEALSISGVIHHANITVDEAGTEAAAATAVIAPTGAAPGPAPEPVVLDVDRPFFFAIRDAESGTILFQGHVNDPTSSQRGTRA